MSIPVCTHRQSGFSASSALPFFGLAIFINMFSSLKFGLNTLKMQELANMDYEHTALYVCAKISKILIFTRRRDCEKYIPVFDMVLVSESVVAF
jgi:hypothetical protein